MGKKKSSVETQSDVPVCRNGHVLKLDAAEDDYECDICDGEVSCGHSFYGCMPCDYSICFKCHARLLDDLKSSAERAQTQRAQNDHSIAEETPKISGFQDFSELQPGTDKKSLRDQRLQRFQDDPELIPTPIVRDEASELARMKEQNALRELLHGAIAERNAKELQIVLNKAQGVLLDGEIHTAQIELVAIRAEEGKRIAQATISEKLSEAVENDSIQDLEDALEMARCCACPELLHQKVLEAETHLASLMTEELLQRTKEATWAEVQQAIREDDVGLLLNILSTREHLLSDARYQEAQRKIPAMQVRSQIRRELKLAFRPDNDIWVIRQVVHAAKRSCLPRDEVAVAEEKLKELEKAAKDGRVKANALAKAKAERELDSSVFDDEDGKNNDDSTISPKTQLQEFMGSPWGIQLIEAIRSGDPEKKRSTIEAAQFAGITTREISRLQAHLITFGYPRSPVAA